MQRWFPIDTERLLLRDLRETDFNDIHEYASDTELSRLDRWGPNTPEITRGVVQGWLDQQQLWPRDEVNLDVKLAQRTERSGRSVECISTFFNG